MAQEHEDGTGMPDDDSLRSRLQKQGEETIGKLAQELLENPLVTNALSRAFEAREKASQAQEVAMGALNLPSASDLERLTRRLRSVAQRLEGIEDGLDRVEERMEDLSTSSKLADRLTGVEKQLSSLVAELGELRKQLPEPSDPLPREQERMPVEADA
jgi:septal ring factor EnvC (AmiA/AmiB activator)